MRRRSSSRYRNLHTIHADSGPGTAERRNGRAPHLPSACRSTTTFFGSSVNSTTWTILTDFVDLASVALISNCTNVFVFICRVSLFSHKRSSHNRCRTLSVNSVHLMHSRIGESHVFHWQDLKLSSACLFCICEVEERTSPRTSARGCQLQRKTRSRFFAPRGHFETFLPATLYPSPLNERRAHSSATCCFCATCTMRTAALVNIRRTKTSTIATGFSCFRERALVVRGQAVYATTAA